MPSNRMEEVPWWQQCSWDIGGQHVQEQADMLAAHGVSRANLTHHLAGCRELQELTSISSGLRWSVHLSSKSLGANPLELNMFKTLLPQVKNLEELLVVSGNPMPKRDSFQLLGQLSEIKIPKAFSISALDPLERILRKVAAPEITHLYLQLVSEPDVYGEVVELVRSASRHMHISYAWLVPTHANWVALRLRPWYGSALSKQWKDDFSYAEHSAQRMLEWCTEQGVTPLIEPRRLTEASFATASKYTNCRKPLS